MPFKWLTGKRFNTQITTNADRVEHCFERPTLVDWPADVDGCLLQAMDWYNDHPGYDRPTTLPPSTRGYSAGNVVSTLNNSRSHSEYPS